MYVRDYALRRGIVLGGEWWVVGDRGRRGVDVAAVCTMSIAAVMLW